MSILLKKIGPSSYGAFAVAGMIIISTFPSCSTASCFVVYFVASFTEGTLNPFINNFNDKSSVALKLHLL